MPDITKGSKLKHWAFVLRPVLGNGGQGGCLGGDSAQLCNLH